MGILRKYYLDSQLLIEREELRKLEEKNTNNNKDIQSLINYKKFEIETLIKELAGFDN